jgi:hypothetical protein
MISRLERAHKHSSFNRKELKMSYVVGCFYCCRLYSPKDIKNWIDDNQTALCPHCGIDSVIGSDSGYMVNIEFLNEMYQRWFNTFVEVKL